MTRFALPFSPSVSEVRPLIGQGFRPAWQPADYIGPRMDCPRWVAAPDADLPYGQKIDPYAPLAGYGWGTWLPPAGAAKSAAKNASTGPGPGEGASAIPHPFLPLPRFEWPGPFHPGPGVVHHPPEVPVPAPVPLPASAVLLPLALVALLLVRKRKCRFAE